jgi:hypothetical protein
MLLIMTWLSIVDEQGDPAVRAHGSVDRTTLAGCGTYDTSAPGFPGNGIPGITAALHHCWPLIIYQTPGSITGYRTADRFDDRGLTITRGRMRRQCRMIMDATMTSPCR